MHYNDLWAWVRSQKINPPDKLTLTRIYDDNDASRQGIATQKTKPVKATKRHSTHADAPEVFSRPSLNEN